MLKIFSNNLGKRFPELLGIPRNVQQDIVEQARYETFTQVKGSNGRFAWRFIALVISGMLSAGVLGFFLGAGAASVSAAAGISASIAVYLQQKSWTQQIHPKVRELAKRYIPPDE